MDELHLNLVGGRAEHDVLVAKCPLPLELAAPQLLGAADNGHVNADPFRIKGPAPNHAKGLALLRPAGEDLLDRGVVIGHVGLAADLDACIVVLQINLGVGSGAILDHDGVGLADHRVVLAVGLNDPEAVQSKTHMLRGHNG